MIDALIDTLLANGNTSGLPIPLHPFLVNFTAALVPLSFACDLLGVWFKKPPLLATGWITLLVAALITPFTVAAGWYWMSSMEHAGHGQMAYHQWLGVTFAVLLIPLAVWRGRLYQRDRAPRWTYAAAAIVLVAALVVQAELGASMSFGRGLVIPAESEEHGHDTMPEGEHGNGKSERQGEAGTGGGHGHGGQAEGMKTDHKGMEMGENKTDGHPAGHGGEAKDPPAGQPGAHGGGAAKPRSLQEDAMPSTAPSAAEMLEPFLSGPPPAATAPVTTPESTPKAATKQKEHPH